MRSVSSTLSKDRLMKDYAKSQQIKNRISRYATHQNRVTLKYLPLNIGPSSSSKAAEAWLPTTEPGTFSRTGSTTGPFRLLRGPEKRGRPRSECLRLSLRRSIP